MSLILKALEPGGQRIKNKKIKRKSTNRNLCRSSDSLSSALILLFVFSFISVVVSYFLLFVANQ